MTNLLKPAHRYYYASSLGIDLGLTLPEGLHDLLGLLLAGWDSQTVTSLPNPDICVERPDRFAVVSPHYESGKTYGDLVSVLNEVLVALAYAARSRVDGTDLIHAAGYAEGSRATVLFGARKAGKSVMTAQKAVAGARIWADDLLLWHPKRREFTGLGIAPRLRRPVLPDILEGLPKSSFVTGEFTCYLAARAIDMAPAGEVLHPDRVEELKSDQSRRNIGLLHIGREIDRHRIP